MTELQKCELAKSKGFTYCSITGNLKGVRGKVIVGNNSDGYILCKVYVSGKPRNLLGHRLAWYLHHGKLPVHHIDHIDGNTSNNKIENLRDVTNQQNHFNERKAKGYYWHKSTSKFMARIKLNGKHNYLGCFDNEEDARKAYLEAKKKYHMI